MVVCNAEHRFQSEESRVEQISTMQTLQQPTSCGERCICPQTSKLRRDEKGHMFMNYIVVGGYFW